MTSGTTSGSPLIKAYPISRDVSSSIVETFINQGHVQTSQHQINSPTLSVAVSGSNNPNTFVSSQGSHILHHGSVITSTSNAMHPNSSIQGQGYGVKTVTTPQAHHQLVQVHGPINVNTTTGTVSLPVQSIHGNLTSSYYIDQKNMNVSILPAPGSVTGGQVRPIVFDKRTMNLTSTGSDGKSALVTGPMILTTNPSQQYSQSPNAIHGPVTIPIGAHSFAHPIPMAHQQGQGQVQHNQQIIATSQPQGITLSKSTSLITNNPITHGLSHTFTSHGHPMTHNIGGHHITVTPHISIPTQVISSQSLSSPSVTMSASTTTTSLSSIITTSGAAGPTTNIVTVSVNNTTGSSTASVISTTSSSTTSSSVIASSSNSSTTTTSTPVQSPSQSSKATLSPRPSILRKREAAAGAVGAGGSDIYAVPFRAQRNLAINFSGTNSTNSLSGLPTIAVSINSTTINSGTPSVTISTVSAAAANKENNATGNSGPPLTMTSIGQGGALITPLLGMGGSGSISILKKEFQPPNEESSWQSCSSNSSSGSTTLSTTSETAEIQLQQGSTDLSNLGLGGLHNNNNISNISSIPNMIIHTSSSSSTPIAPSGMGMSRGHSNTSSGTSMNMNHQSIVPPMITINPTHNGILHVVRSHPPNNSVNMGPNIRHRTSSVSKGGKDLERGKGRGKDVVSPRKKPRKQQL